MTRWEKGELSRSVNSSRESVFTISTHTISPLGKSCRDIKTRLPHAQDGMYQVQPDGGHNMFSVYCDMTSFGGGWTMCYSTDSLVNPKTEVTYDENLPYGTNGYRTDCNNIKVTLRKNSRNKDKQTSTFRNEDESKNTCRYKSGLKKEISLIKTNPVHSWRDFARDNFVPAADPACSARGKPVGEFSTITVDDCE